MPEIKQDIRAATLVVASNDSLHKNMADYVCDGVADDVEIQAAITALPARGGTVLLLEGTFVLAQPIILPQINEGAVEGFALVGMGEGATVLSGATDGAIKYDSDTATNHITIQGMTLRCYYTTSQAMYLRNVYYSVIRDITIRGTGGSVAEITGDGLVMESCNTIDVINLRSIMNDRWGVYLGAVGKSVNAIHFFGCAFQWNGQGGVAGGGVNVFRGTANTFTDCDIEGNDAASGIGIQFEEDTAANKISGVFFEGNLVADVLMKGTPIKNVVSNCYANGDLGGGAKTDYFVKLEAGVNISIENNLEYNHDVNAVLVSAGVIGTILNGNNFEATVSDLGIETKYEDRAWFNYPFSYTIQDFYGWSTAIVNSGVVTNVIGCYLTTGVVAGSTAIADSWMKLTANGNSAIDYGYYIEIEWDISRWNVAAGTQAWLKVETNATPADPAAAAIGFRIDQFAIKGQVHNGAALTTVDLSTNTSQDIIDRPTIKFYPGDRIEWWVNGILKGQSANIPAGLVNQGARIVLAVNNNAVAGAMTCVVSRIGFVYGKINP